MNWCKSLAKKNRPIYCCKSVLKEEGKENKSNSFRMPCNVDRSIDRCFISLNKTELFKFLQRDCIYDDGDIKEG